MPREPEFGPDVAARARMTREELLAEVGRRIADGRLVLSAHREEREAQIEREMVRIQMDAYGDEVEAEKRTAATMTTRREPEEG